MNVDIDQIMEHPVMTVTPHQSAGHIRALMAEHRVSVVPVVDPDGVPVGIVTAADLLTDRPDGTPIGNFMSTPVYTVPRSDGPRIVARIMRDHRLHHVVVTENKAVVGIVSASALLQLVEDHRFDAKPGPTPPGRLRRRR